MAQTSGAHTDGGSRLRWLGHATAQITDRGTTVLTDPVLTSRVAHLRRRRGATPSTEVTQETDVVVLSHLHADHTHVPSLRKIGDDVPIVVPRRAPDVLPALREVGSRLVEMSSGDELRLGDIAIRAVPAEHDGRRWRHGPHVTMALGYVVVGDRTTYFAGDTDVYPELDQWVHRPDVALLPVGGWGPTLGHGHMDPERAVTAAQVIEADLAVPIHFGTLWPIGLDRVRPSRFHDPGAEFVGLAEERGVRAVELSPGDGLDDNDDAEHGDTEDDDD
ncbi:MBL fold metallo-hydrolase [Gordonia sp. CPCC 206044]|uniref:MBL fold metallo-hydrolase n=1 Tax=Gordonia sp. CPCC 206044 TaxID=3140793 RepID=UPI003AF3D07C